MRPDTAATRLGLELTGLTEPQIVKAAAGAIAKAHPDNGGDPELAPDQIANAKKCRETLIAHVRNGVPDGFQNCPVCSGKGYVRAAGWLRTECPKCKGEGIVRL